MDRLFFMFAETNVYRFAGIVNNQFHAALKARARSSWATLNAWRVAGFVVLSIILVSDTSVFLF